MFNCLYLVFTSCFLCTEFYIKVSKYIKYCSGYYYYNGEYYFYLYNYEHVLNVKYAPAFSFADGALTAPDCMMYFSANVGSSRKEASKVWFCVFQPAAVQVVYFSTA